METTAGIPNPTDTLFAAFLLTAMDYAALGRETTAGEFAAGESLEAAKTPLDDDEEDEDEDEDLDDEDDDDDLEDDDDLVDEDEDDDLEDDDDEDDEDEDDEEVEDDDPKPLRVKSRL